MSKDILFPLGSVVVTPGALAVLDDNNISAVTLLAQHVTGNWGVVPKEDCNQNDLAVKKGFRILSSYFVGKHKVWVITEADRSSTCILLPSEY